MHTQTYTYKLTKFRTFSLVIFNAHHHHSLSLHIRRLCIRLLCANEWIKKKIKWKKISDHEACHNGIQRNMFLFPMACINSGDKTEKKISLISFLEHISDICRFNEFICWIKHIKTLENRTIFLFLSFLFYSSSNPTFKHKLYLNQI